MRRCSAANMSPEARPGESPGAASEGDAVTETQITPAESNSQTMSVCRRSEDPRKIKRLQQEPRDFAHIGSHFIKGSLGAGMSVAWHLLAHGPGPLPTALQEVQRLSQRLQESEIFSVRCREEEKSLRRVDLQTYSASFRFRLCRYMSCWRRAC